MPYTGLAPHYHHLLVAAATSAAAGYRSNLQAIIIQLCSSLRIFPRQRQQGKVATCVVWGSQVGDGYNGIWILVLLVHYNVPTRTAMLSEKHNDDYIVSQATLDWINTFSLGHYRLLRIILELSCLWRKTLHHKIWSDFKSHIFIIKYYNQDNWSYEKLLDQGWVWFF